MALRDVALDDKYTAAAGRVVITGTQALVRLPLLNAAAAVERRVQARNARPLPEYAPAR